MKMQRKIKSANEELFRTNEALKNANLILEEQQEVLISAKEKAEKSDKLKTAFLQNMSHEIRTPLNGIIGFSDLMVDNSIPMSEKISFTRYITQCSNQLLGIVNDILDISQIEAGIAKIYLEETELVKFLSDLRGFFAARAREKTLDIQYVIPSGMEQLIIETDAKKLWQILNNLLNNSIKFTEKGSITFGFERMDGLIRFFVRDSGIGIPEEMHKTVFERFRQGSIDMHPKYGGNGLGLSICEKLVQLLGGEIWLESKVGMGTIFYFTIPYIPAGTNK
jgi:signal transduction histidine kinase